jgi:8-oxo-dGTP pyrophosphatase MutT (NUDIX family)
LIFDLLSTIVLSGRRERQTNKINKILNTNTNLLTGCNMPKYFAPHVTVAAVAVREVENTPHFLMVEEHPQAPVLNQPAGHVENGESLLAAVVRETQEETAWEVAPVALIGIYRWVTPSGKTFFRHTFLVNCLCFHPELPLDREIIGAYWLPLSEITQRPLRSPLVLASIHDYLAGQRYDLALFRDLTTF